jgi:transcriptional regulator with XRE-family HTH domain
MKTVGERIRKLRKDLELTQNYLAEKAGITYVQIGRYERKGAIPSADVLAKIADTLNTTSDYLMNGDTGEIASRNIIDKELLSLFKAVEQLSQDDKTMIKTFIDALVTKRKIQGLAS